MCGHMSKLPFYFNEFFHLVVIDKPLREFFPLDFTFVTILLCQNLISVAFSYMLYGCVHYKLN